MLYKRGKLILSGSVIELFRFYGVEGTYTLPAEQDPRALALKRARTRLRRLINANFGMWFDPSLMRFYTPLFITLTFADNIQDIPLANRYFSKFVQRFNYQVFGSKRAKLKYITVIEFQDRGAIHYHSIFFNVPFVPDLILRLKEIWGFGRVDFSSITHVHNVGSYVVKYMSKEFDDPRLKGKKLYFSSKGLYKPTVITDDVKIMDLMSYVSEYNPRQLSLLGLDYDKYIVTKDDPARFLGLLNQKVKIPLVVEKHIDNQLKFF